MKLAPTLHIFIPLAFGLSAVLFVSYVNDQQILRQDANNPQHALAEDVAHQLGDDGSGAYITTEKIPIESSASPYIVVYDAFGKPVKGSGYLDGALPQIPSGIFDVVRGQGIDVLTWEPRGGVRSAIVVVPVSGGAGGYVLGGKSLRFTEQQEDMLTKRAFFGWLAVMIAVLVGSLIPQFLKLK